MISQYKGPRGNHDEVATPSKTECDPPPTLSPVSASMTVPGARHADWSVFRQSLCELQFISRVIHDPKITIAPSFSKDTLMDLSAASFEFLLEIVESISKDVN